MSNVVTLDHVVNAFEDYRPSSRGSTSGPSQLTIGDLFHDTAEQAASRGTRQAEDWVEICERLAEKRRARGTPYPL
ncbi:hypothetical protein GCM10009037_01190 [Halarchaeum grantii]|uniref:Uncharacterized protein n=1 Tax=Halarchaeum grantii TaxID=1193105 RepID=A0A830F8I0_9EURY|nr:hypothetical protein [Halarchaeum grantii]GGL21641.1 hypothetical protein GCM10009037_01190 [Halarchaeum grantii]